jgi:hypothetical protein
LFVVGAGLVAWMLVASSSARAASVREASKLSVSEVYSRVEQAVGRAGRVYHQTGKSRSTGAVSGTETTETWIDGDNDLMRTQWPKIPFVRLIAGGVHYAKTKAAASVTQEPARHCFGASAAVSALLGCPLRSGALRSTVSVQDGTWRGNEVVVLVTKFGGKGKVPHGESRMYLDAKTFLPLGGEGTTIQGSGKGPRKIDARTTYRASFPPSTSLAPDFFTTPAIESWVASQ